MHNDRPGTYTALRDSDAAKHSQVRVVDESGNAYLFPSSLFATVTVRGKARLAMPGVI